MKPGNVQKCGEYNHVPAENQEKPLNYGFFYTIRGVLRHYNT